MSTASGGGSRVRSGKLSTTSATRSPVFGTISIRTSGKRQVRAITVTDVLEWVALLLRNNVAQSSVKTYFDLFNAVMNAAVADKVISDNRCKAVRLSAILRGFSRAPKWVPTDEDMLALVDAVPDRYQAALWCGAGEGLRLGEVRPGGRGAVRRPAPSGTARGSTAPLSQEPVRRLLPRSSEGWLSR
ncbi:hypothetical protein [Micromonospora sp. KC721]|uniref:hypothetical protein n=1 Tax=Micromonospora sp. KC721 TaxID=2530380 RepID=UPI001FB6234A|nr:hypothetical protein [Micromonospora sp. KC721]